MSETEHTNKKSPLEILAGLKTAMKAKEERGYCTRHLRTAEVVEGPVHLPGGFYVVYDCCDKPPTNEHLRTLKYFGVVEDHKRETHYVIRR